MQCMKCGREIPLGEAFCEECVAEMEKYPVKPGTVVQLPRRPRQPQQRKATPRRSVTPPEEQVKRLKKAVRFLLILWAVTVLVAVAAGYIFFRQYRDNTGKYLPGQNYSTITDSTGLKDK